jgi:YbbR domain-containing protein
MALAFCLWLSLAGLDTSVVDFPIALNLHSLPEHLLIKGETPKEVTVRVRANAAQVRFLADRKLSLSLDLSQAQEGYNAFPVHLESIQMPRGVEVSGISHEIIEFETLYLSQKSVPVKPNVVGHPAPSFRLEGLTLEPAEVIINGPPEAIAQVDHLETTPLAVEGLTRDAIFAVTLLPPPDGIVTIIGVKEVQATVKISEIRTQAVFSDVAVEIEARNGEAASFIAQPSRVSVTIAWPSSRSRPVNAREVRAKVSVDGGQLKTEGRITVPVVAVPPSGAAVMAINPAKVAVSYVPSASEKSKVKP